MRVNAINRPYLDRVSVPRCLETDEIKCILWIASDKVDRPRYSRLFLYRPIQALQGKIRMRPKTNCYGQNFVCTLAFSGDAVML